MENIVLKEFCRVCCVIVCRQVLRVVPGSKLFLFNYRVKEMSGIFEATGHGGMNIVQDAFKGLFPAQVKIRCISTCPNLPASIFKRAIHENYFDISKFKYELTTIQVCQNNPRLCHIVKLTLSCDQSISM
jgi:hypothetical protein